jgi:hypothetical protein
VILCHCHAIVYADNTTTNVSSGNLSHRQSVISANSASLAVIPCRSLPVTIGTLLSMTSRRNLPVTWGTSRNDVSVAAPSSGNDLTVYRATAMIQGTVKDAINAVIPGVTVRLRNSDSTVTAGIICAADGTYRLAAPSGPWLVDALTENKGHYAVPEQSFILADGENLQADFTVGTCANQPVRILGAETRYFDNLLLAYAAAGSGETLQLQTIIFGGDFVLSRDINVRLQGGFDCGYADNGAATIISGPLRVKNGTVGIERLRLR